ncbi:MAG: hypothetical protein AAFQ94_01090 [Bacteroidota bacterium]
MNKIFCTNFEKGKIINTIQLKKAIVLQIEKIAEESMSKKSDESIQDKSNHLKIPKIDSSICLKKHGSAKG